MVDAWPWIGRNGRNGTVVIICHPVSVPSEQFSQKNNKSFEEFRPFSNLINVISLKSKGQVGFLACQDSTGLICHLVSYYDSLTWISKEWMEKVVKLFKWPSSDCSASNQPGLVKVSVEFPIFLPSKRCEHCSSRQANTDEWLVLPSIYKLFGRRACAVTQVPWRHDEKETCFISDIKCLQNAKFGQGQPQNTWYMNSGVF